MLSFLFFAIAFVVHGKSISPADYHRAVSIVPGDEFRGNATHHYTTILNNILRQKTNLHTKPCAQFSSAELYEIEKVLFSARDQDLNEIYSKGDDNRVYQYHSVTDLESEYSSLLVAEDADDKALKCSEIVMWYVHHTTNHVKQQLFEAFNNNFTIPLLEETPTARRLHGQIGGTPVQAPTCAECHE
eukprot:231562_1